jgi:outer membrane protein TolC
MKMKRLISFLLSAALGGSLPGLYAQSMSLSLKECLDITLERNLQMNTAENAVEMAELNYLTRKAAFLPNVNANATGFKNLGTTIDNFSQTIAQNPLQAQVSLNAGVTVQGVCQLEQPQVRTVQLHRCRVRCAGC